MKIHEYQARQLLANASIPVPAGTMVTSIDEANQAAASLLDAGATLLVVKAQVHAGGRGKAGFVKLCKTKDEVTKAAQQGVAALRRGLDQHALLLGPGPAPLARLRGHFRWQALLRGESVHHLHQQVTGALPTMRETAKNHATTFAINVDPLTMM